MKNLILAIFVFIVSGFIFAVEISAHPSWAIVVDAQNRIYVSDLEKVWKIDENGRVSVFAEKHTHELTLDRNGNLLGEEVHYEPSTQKFSASLWQITPRGDFSYILTRTETPPKGISNWKNTTGATFYFGQTETPPKEFYLLKRNPNGTIKVLLGDERKALAERQIVPYSFGGMAFATDGALYFKNSETIWKATLDDKISVVADKQKLSAVAPNPMLFGLTVDAENNVFTADYNGRNVLKIAPDKRISIAFQSEKDWTPTGVYARDKNFYVLENKNLPPGSNPVIRVQKIGEDGKNNQIALIGETQTKVSNDTNQNNSFSPNQRQPNNKLCAALGLVFVSGLISGKVNCSRYI